MADSKVTLETKIKITGVEMAKGLKAGNLKLNINQAHFKSQIDKVKTRLASAISKLRVQPQLSVSKASLANLKRQITEGLRDIQIGVSSGGRRGGGGGPRGPGGGGSGGGGGRRRDVPGFGQSGDDFLLLLTQVPRLDALVKNLGATFRKDLLGAIVDTGAAGDKARQRLADLVRTQQQLSTAIGKGPVDPRAVLGATAQKDLQNELKRTAKIAKDTKAAMDDLKKSGRKFEANKQFRDLQKEATRLNLTTNQLAASIDKVFGAGRVGRGGAVDFGSFFGKGGSFDQFKNAQRDFEKASAAGSKFGNIIEEVGRKAAVFRIASVAINSVANAISNAGQFIVEFDGKLRDINKILQLTNAGLNRLGASITTLAGDTGVAATDIGGIAEELARAGLAGRGFGSVLELTDNILTGVQGTTLNTAEATEFMIQTIGQLEAGMKGLRNELVTTSQGFDILGKAEDITASKASDVVNAFKRSGASLLSTGATFEEIAALISVTQERTRRGAEVIGTAFKTIATRISNPASEASRALRSIGVETVDAAGNLRGIFDIIQDTSRAFDGLTEAQQASISATVAGVRQVEIFRNIINSSGRQVDVLAQLQSAGGDAARKQAQEQLKLGVIIDQIKNKLSALVESARASGLDSFFKTLLAGINGLLTGVVAIDKALGGAFTGTTLAFALAKGFSLAVKIFRRLATGFGQFLVSLNTVPKTMSGVATSAAAVGQILVANAQATGMNVEQTRRWAQELENVKAQLAAANASTQTAAANTPGRFGAAGQKVKGGLEAIGKELTFTRLLGASLAFEAIEQAAGSMNSVLLESVASVGQMAVNGALLGSAFGPAGAAVGGLTGAIGGLVSSFMSADSEAARFAELTKTRFTEIAGAADSLEFDTFSAAVSRANKGLGELTRQLAELSPDLIGARSKRIGRQVSSVADDPEFLKLGPQERAKRFNDALSRAIGEQFKELGDFDINKITDISSDLDLEKIKDILTSVLAERLGKPLSEAKKLVDVELIKLENKARALEGKSAQIGTTVRSELDKFSNGFDVFVGLLGAGESGDIVDTVQLLRSAQANLKSQAASLRSTGGIARAISDLIQNVTVIPEAIDKERERLQRLARGGQASRFELQNLFADFFDLSDILEGAGSGSGELENAFKSLGSFSAFANTFRTAAAKFLTDAEALRMATLKASEPLDKMAQLEARLAEQQLERLRSTTKLTQTSKIITLLDSFQASLGSLGEDKDAFDQFAKQVINTVDAVSRFGEADPETALNKLTQAAQEFTTQAKQIDNKEVVSATKKLFSGVTEVFIQGQTAIRNKELELRRKQLSAVKEQFKGFEESSKALIESAQLEELRNSVITNQLSGLDKIIAEEQALADVTNARAAALREELAALRNLSGTGISGDARNEVNKRIAQRERELTKILLEEQKKRGALERRRVDESIRLAKSDSSFTSDILKKRMRLNDLLGEEARGIDRFNNALKNNQAILRSDLKGLQQSIAAVGASTIPAVEKEKKLKDLRREITKRTLEAAIAEAEILNRRKEAIKELVSNGLKRQDELKEAQKEVFEKTKEVAEAFNEYADATQAVIAATTEYTVGLRLAGIEGQRLKGSFLGIKDQINAVANVFRRAEQVALAVGAGEKIIADLRKKSIAEQIKLFNELLSQQQSAARSFFTSSREDQAKLFQSIQTVKGIVDSGLFGGSFDEFKKLGEDAINAIGAQLLALPQETRQGLVDAIQTLSTLGVGVGGFSAAELQNILDTVALGASEELDVDPLFEVQSRIADLTEEQARLQLDGIVAANEQVQIAKEQLAEARAAKKLAEIQMDRLQQSVDKIDSRIAGLSGSGSSSVTSRGNEIRRSINEGSRNNAAVSYGSAAATLSTGEGFARGSGGTSNLRNDGTQKTTNDILRKIESLLTTKFDEQIAQLVEIRESQEATTSTAGATGATAAAPLQADFNIQIDGNQQVRVTGLSEGLNTVISNIVNTFGPFVTEEQARETIVQPVLDQINKFLLERGLSVLGFQ